MVKSKPKKKKKKVPGAFAERLMTSFDMFEEKFGPGKSYAPVGPRLAARFEKLGLPAYYVEYLRARGLQSFANGFWWFTNPLELRDTLAPFTGSEEALPVLRSAFGCFLVWHGDAFHHLNPHVGNFVKLTPELAIILNATMVDAYAMRDLHFHDQFESVIDRLGPVKADEMYAFAPALRMGGTVRPDGVHIAKLREHLAFLAQL
jgi:hypothetical protein